MTIRLAFTGASGTGKSTLASALSAELNIPMCNVGSREVAKSMGFDNPYDVDKAGKRAEFQTKLLQAKISWETKHRADGFVTDRTYFDNLAYTLKHQPELAADQAFRREVCEGMRIYTHIVFCPISAFHNLAGDVARVSELSYHHEYELTLISLFRSKMPGGTPVLWLTSSSVETRLDTIRKFVRP